MSGHVCPHDPYPGGCAPAIIWGLMLVSFAVGVFVGICL